MAVVIPARGQCGHSRDMGRLADGIRESACCGTASGAMTVGRVAGACDVRGGTGRTGAASTGRKCMAGMHEGRDDVDTMVRNE
jgi:hypothetical protein